MAFGVILKCKPRRVTYIQLEYHLLTIAKYHASFQPPLSFQLPLAGQISRSRVAPDLVRLDLALAVESQDVRKDLVPALARLGPRKGRGPARRHLGHLDVDDVVDKTHVLVAEVLGQQAK